MGPLLTRDDLDELSETATGSADPAAVAARLVEAAASGRLADPADSGYAYLLAAEIHERAEDLGEALALADQAVAAYRRAGSAELTQPRSYRARLLHQLGREDEASAELAELARVRPLLATDPYDDGFEEEGAGAEEAAAKDGYEAGYEAGYGDGGEPAETPEAVLLVWPKDAYELVDQRWPEVLEPTGADSWEDYRRYCQAVIAGWSGQHGTLYQITGDADEFEEWLSEQGADPYYANLVSLATTYGQYLADRGDPVALPPDRDDPCWCGSGVSYGGCCQQLSP